jgi:hypothetical protein
MSCRRSHRDLPNSGSVFHRRSINAVRCAYRYLLSQAQDVVAQPAPGARRSKTHRPQHECSAFITPPRSVARLGTARTNLLLRSMYTLWLPGRGCSNHSLFTLAPWISAVQHRGGSDLSIYMHTLAPWISGRGRPPAETEAPG